MHRSHSSRRLTGDSCPRARGAPVVRVAEISFMTSLKALTWVSPVAVREA
ncbi:MAG: hypothetical protein N0E58_08850 [Candidatus Thiodiazotropha endolucinida]|nr:hypothetical protein [Candidatus Thiodiazotropha endolucinida]